jgi:hypothetical protein
VTYDPQHRERATNAEPRHGQVMTVGQSRPGQGPPGQPPEGGLASRIRLLAYVILLVLALGGLITGLVLVNK